jgi:hypothetical protein
MSSKPQVFKPVFDRLYESFNVPDSPTDPIQIVRRFNRLEDREIVAFVASSLAFGRVASVMASVEAVCRVLGGSPAARSPLDARTGLRRIAVDSEAHARRLRFHRTRVCRGTGTWRLRRWPCARGIFGPRQAHPTAPGIWAGAQTARGLLLFRSAVDRRRVQAAEPVPPMDGPAGRGRSWRLDDGGSEAAGRSARYAHHPNGEVPSFDPTGHTRLEDGGGDH